MTAVAGQRTPARRLARWLYAPWTWLVFLPLALLATGVLGVTAWLLAHLRPSLAQHCARAWGWTACLLNFTPVRLSGREHVRPGQAYVVMANHQSHFDILSICARLPMQFRWVMKKELRSAPVIGPACHEWGCIFVDRENREQAIASLEGAERLLREGTSLFVYPEGTRQRDGRLGAFKKGGFMVALQLGLPILPVTISGAGGILPANTKALLPGRIRLTMHEPVDTRAYGMAGRDRLIADVRSIIASALPRDQLGAEERPAAPAAAPRPVRADPERKAASA